ncbi:MAG: sigma-70 family RNA polymerase sigma factor [Sphingomonadales bacterium]|nr:sigma-70 family RNA polymerase sigma factor [Sphingomonadales bacterium]
MPTSCATRRAPRLMAIDDADADLVASAVAGDRDAFAALLDRHYDRIHGLAWQMTGSRADADDIAQDVCCILAEKIGHFRGDAKFTTWLCAIVFNACREFGRRRSAFSRFTGRLSQMVGLAANPDGRDLYDAIWIESAIARLKPDLRDTAILVAGQQLTHAEAADILGIAEATVSWRMHEIRRQLAPNPAADD